MVENNCCSGCSSCCGQVKEQQENRTLVIDLLYLDLSVCDRCQGAESNLEQAIQEVKVVIEATGTTVKLNKKHIQNEEQAKEFAFLSSPTIRVNGKDIQMDVRENSCQSCGDLCGDDVDCRIWVYQGKEYTTPPKAMIIEAILKAVYSGDAMDDFISPQPLTEIPDNLKRFFAGKSN